MRWAWLLPSLVEQQAHAQPGQRAVDPAQGGQPDGGRARVAEVAQGHRAERPAGQPGQQPAAGRAIAARPSWRVVQGRQQPPEQAAEGEAHRQRQEVRALQRAQPLGQGERAQPGQRAGHRGGGVGRGRSSRVASMRDAQAQARRRQAAAAQGDRLVDARSAG